MHKFQEGTVEQVRASCNDFHSSLHRNSPCHLPEQLQFLDTISMEQESV